MKINFFDGSTLRLWNKPLVFIDWSNVYKTYCEPNNILLFKESYKVLEGLINFWKNSGVEEKNFFIFVGVDEEIYSSVRFVEELKKEFPEIKLFVKKVKKIKIEDEFKRKADFDSEIGWEICRNIKVTNSFIIFSSDGDFAYIYENILKMGKQVVVFHGFTLREKKIAGKSKKKAKKYNLGKEIGELQKKYKILRTIFIGKLFEGL